MTKEEIKEELLNFVSDSGKPLLLKAIKYAEEVDLDIVTLAKNRGDFTYNLVFIIGELYKQRDGNRLRGEHLTEVLCRISEEWYYQSANRWAKFDDLPKGSLLDLAADLSGISQEDYAFFTKQELKEVIAILGKQSNIRPGYLFNVCKQFKHHRIRLEALRYLLLSEDTVDVYEHAVVYHRDKEAELLQRIKELSAEGKSGKLYIPEIFRCIYPDINISNPDHIPLHIATKQLFVIECLYLTGQLNPEDVNRITQFIISDRLEILDTLVGAMLSDKESTLNYCSLGLPEEDLYTILKVIEDEEYCIKTYDPLLTICGDSMFFTNKCLNISVRFPRTPNLNEVAAQDAVNDFVNRNRNIEKVWRLENEKHIFR